MVIYGKRPLLLLALMAGFAPAFSHAVSNQIGDSVKVAFTGRLQLVTPCTISNDQLITVEFGNVAVNRVDSGNYTQTVEYTLDCGSAGSGNTVSMVFKATPVPSDAAAFASSAPGLWVKVLKDGQPLELNKAFSIANPESPPKVQVQLVRDPASELSAGGFSAIGTLMADYV